MRKTIDYLKTLLNKNDKIVIGVSGGPDSMCLLHVVNSLKKEYNLSIIVAHINHNIRKESVEEAKFVKNYCKKNNMFFESMTIEKYNKEDNFHQDARKIRYDFFEKIVSKYNAEYLMSAHHGDDLMETILMRIARGSTLKGYSGFDLVSDRDNYKIIKPLIFASRSDIEKYLKDNNISYCTDASNLEDHYTRNRYRHHVLPFLKEEDANIHERFLKFHDTLASYEEYFTKIVAEKKNSIYKDKKLDLKNFKKLDKLLQIKIISDLFHNIYSDEILLINDKHIDLILNLIKKSGNTSIMLPSNMIAIKSYDTLEIRKNEIEEISYKLELGKEVILPNGKTISIIDNSNSKDNFCTRINSRELKLPLYVRNRTDGDKMVIKNMNGTKKINDIFIDKKIIKNERDRWPIVTDANNEIIWLPGLKKSKFDKDISEKYDIILWYH